MSAIYRHATRHEMTDKNPIRDVRQSGKGENIPVILDVAEIYRLFDELQPRERAMVVSAVLTGIRRSELSGLKWQDLDFIGKRIHIVRSMVDRVNRVLNLLSSGVI